MTAARTKKKRSAPKWMTLRVPRAVEVPKDWLGRIESRLSTFRGAARIMEHALRRLQADVGRIAALLNCTTAASTARTSILAVTPSYPELEVDYLRKRASDLGARARALRTPWDPKPARPSTPRRPARRSRPRGVPPLSTTDEAWLRRQLEGLGTT